MNQEQRDRIRQGMAQAKSKGQHKRMAAYRQFLKDFEL
jgi:hypothetical protein